MCIGGDLRATRGRHMSMKIGQRPPIFRDARLGRSHRDLGRAAGYERGEDHPEEVPVRIAGSASEQQTVGSPGAASGGEPPSEAPPGLRGQRRGYEEASGLEVEDRVHAREILLTSKLSVDALTIHSRDPARSASRGEGGMAGMRTPR